MSTSIAHPGSSSVPGSARAKATTAAAVVALATAIAGTALVGGLVAGSAIEAPGPLSGPAVAETIPVTPPITIAHLEDQPRGGGNLGPLRSD